MTDPLVDMRTREDMRENYLDGLVERPRRLRRRRIPEPQAPKVLDGLGGGNCWCGASFGHDWPGRADGAPHPREAS